jgi:hypothetical protein
MNWTNVGASGGSRASQRSFRRQVTVYLANHQLYAETLATDYALRVPLVGV